MAAQYRRGRYAAWFASDRRSSMIARSAAVVALVSLAACAGNPPPDFAAKNRPLEARCQRVQNQQPRGAQPGQTAADVQAEAKLARSRGELDKACDHL
jgi:hypothetical protein